MYLVPLKTALVEAIKRTFDAEYVVPEFRNLHCSIEFPVEKQAYPGVWVDYEPVGDVQSVGVAHEEFSPPDVGGHVRRFERWRFSGFASYTVVALTSLERDRLYDELVRVMAFGKDTPQTAELRAFIENNEFVGINFDFDQITQRGSAATPGTPWGGDEILYETTLLMECVGEFVSDGSTGTLAPLSAIEVIPIKEGEPDPTTNEGWM